MIKDPVLGPVGAVVPFLINVILGKEIAIMILSALVTWNVVLTIVVLTFQQALIVALLSRQFEGVCIILLSFEDANF